MFDEMVERIQRTTISVLLKVKIEFRTAPAQAPQAPQPQQTAPQAQPVRKPFRRQMPEPIQNMSSYKEAQAKQAEMMRIAAENDHKRNDN